MKIDVSVSDKTSAPRFTLRGWHVIGAFVAFFIAVAAVDAALITLAVSTFGGLETKDAYRKGVDYNRTLAAAEAQERLGWRDDVRFDASGARIETRIIDASGRGIDGLDVVIHLGRPATNAGDTVLKLVGEGDGRYAVRVPGLDGGAWVASLEARRGTASPTLASEPGPAAGTPEGAPVFQSKSRLWRQP